MDLCAESRSLAKSCRVHPSERTRGSILCCCALCVVCPPPQVRRVLPLQTSKVFHRSKSKSLICLEFCWKQPRHSPESSPPAWKLRQWFLSGFLLASCCSVLVSSPGSRSVFSLQSWAPALSALCFIFHLAVVCSGFFSLVLLGLHHVGSSSLLHVSPFGCGLLSVLASSLGLLLSVFLQLHILQLKSASSPRWHHSHHTHTSRRH
jgi:hypothetical protein